MLVDPCFLTRGSAFRRCIPKDQNYLLTLKEEIGTDDHILSTAGSMGSRGAPWIEPGKQNPLPLTECELQPRPFGLRRILRGDFSVLGSQSLCRTGACTMLGRPDEIRQWKERGKNYRA